MKILISVFLIGIGFIGFALIFLMRVESENHHPHIIYIYADDLGWGDLSFHGSPEIPTPNIDALAMNGILLNSYYGQWVCTPSRASLMSGKYPIRIGLQHSVLKGGEQGGLPLDIKTLPQYLKELGYINHMIGKWHLGYMTKDYFPTRRGFDGFHGYMNGNIDPYDYTGLSVTFLNSTPIYFGVDLYKQETLIKNFRGQYATDYFTTIAKQVISEHNPKTPLFLYMSHLAVHGSSPGLPQVAPPKYVDRLMHIPNVNRRIHAASMVALDDSVGEIFKALNDKGMLDNCLVLFISDNGGDARSVFNKHGSNFPLRGAKETLWEGGMRVPAVIWSSLLKGSRISHQLMSVVDWLPTLYRVAGGDPKNIQKIDGIDMWDSLINNTDSPRQELLYNIDDFHGVSAIRKGNMKVINGSSVAADSWYNKPSINCYNTNPLSRNCSFVEKSIVQRILTEKGLWKIQNISDWRSKASISCMKPPAEDKESGCFPNEKPCLFDVVKDPCEHNNLANHYPNIVDNMMAAISSYQLAAVKSQSAPSDPRANPLCHDFSYVPWMEPEFSQKCDAFLEKN